ncbi:hypothetical protein [Allomuricauda sp. SCSIO 65647]|nr:hypothetical protein [Muricauda sp. SCSIO 65647]
MKIVMINAVEEYRKKVLGNLKATEVSDVSGMPIERFNERE